MNHQSQSATPGAVPVLECRNLCISYFTRAGEIPAVVDFNMKLMPGEAQGIVGESGCGKSTVALAIMQYMGANGRIAAQGTPEEKRARSRELMKGFRGKLNAILTPEQEAKLKEAMPKRPAGQRNAKGKPASS